MGALIALACALAIASAFLPTAILWYKRNRCPKCKQWHCLSFVSEVVTDKATGHDRDRYGGANGGRYGGFGGSHTSDQPFIRYWVEERYICQKCGRHVSIFTHKDKR